MARNTRQRRRQRRRAQAANGQQPQQGVSQRARSRQQAVRPAAQAPKTQTGSRRVPGGGFRRFVGESIAATMRSGASRKSIALDVGGVSRTIRS